MLCEHQRFLTTDNPDLPEADDSTPMRSKDQLHQLDLRLKNTKVIALRASQYILIDPLITLITLMPGPRSKEIRENPRQSAVHWRSLRKSGGAERSL